MASVEAFPFTQVKVPWSDNEVLLIRPEAIAALIGDPCMQLEIGVDTSARVILLAHVCEDVMQIKANLSLDDAKAVVAALMSRITWLEKNT